MTTKGSRVGGETKWGATTVLDADGHPGPVWDASDERTPHPSGLDATATPGELDATAARTLRSGEFHGARRRTLRHTGLTLADIEYGPRHSLPEHAHEHPFFCLLVRGTFRESLGHRIRRCVPASMVFYPEHEPHREEFGREGGRAFNVELGGTWIERMRTEGMSYRPGSIESLRGRLNVLMARLHVWFLEGGPAIGTEEYVLELLAEVVDSDHYGHERRPPDWLTRMRDMLHERSTESLRVTDLADEVGVHPVHAARVFRRYHGCTIGAYVRMLRVERARTEMADPDRPLASIAFATGFADQAHLTRCFKEFIGLPPGAYRTLLAS